ncbi:hypothetical protein GGR55DRAFT_504702 [Xylaria sp. FL0064]|nr:hypothetical protein GGR55DRAFT_504702 [Xylaria sp. FL0064]
MRLSMAHRAFVDALALFTASYWALEFSMTEINVSPGKPFTLTWEGANGPVEVSLVTETASNLEIVGVIDSGDTGSSYTWTPSDDLPSGTYAFLISDGDDSNYSPQWSYEASGSASGGGSPAPSSTSASTSTPKPTQTTTTKPPPSTTPALATTKPVTSTKDMTSTADVLTTKSSVSAEATSTAGGSSTDNSEPTSSSSTPTSSTTITTTSPILPGSPSSPPVNSSSDPSPNASASSDENQQQVFSTGTKIGIGIVAGVGGLALVTLAGFLIYRRGKAAGKQDLDDGDTFSQELKPELGGEPRSRVELGGQDLAEMQTDQRIPELWQGHYDEWRRQPSELDATVHHYRGADIGRV